MFLKPDMFWASVLIYIFVYLIVIPIDVILRLTTKISLLGALRVSGVPSTRALAFVLGSATSIPLFFYPVLQPSAPGLLISPAEFQTAELELIGIALSLLGILMVSAAIIKLIPPYLFRREQMAELITTGAYGIIRNPVYAGMALVFLGVFFLRPNLIYLLCLALYSAINHIRVRREEYFLEGHFGDQYNDYVQEVARYLPHPRTWGSNR